MLPGPTLQPVKNLKVWGDVENGIKDPTKRGLYIPLVRCADDLDTRVLFCLDGNCGFIIVILAVDDCEER